MRKALVLGSFLTLFAGQALAQANNAIAVNGVLESFDAASISVKADDGGAVQTFKLASKLLLLQNKAASLADIKSNDFVASAAVRGPDGKLHSTELRIFPDALRGVGSRRNMRFGILKGSKNWCSSARPVCSCLARI